MHIGSGVAERGAGTLESITCVIRTRAEIVTGVLLETETWTAVMDHERGAPFTHRRL